MVKYLLNSSSWMTHKHHKFKMFKSKFINDVLPLPTNPSSHLGHHHQTCTLKIPVQVWMATTLVAKERKWDTSPFLISLSQLIETYWFYHQIMYLSSPLHSHCNCHCLLYVRYLAPFWILLIPVLTSLLASRVASNLFFALDLV